MAPLKRKSDKGAADTADISMPVIPFDYCGPRDLNTQDEDPCDYYDSVGRAYNGGYEDGLKDGFDLGLKSMLELMASTGFNPKELMKFAKAKLDEWQQVKVDSE